VPDIVIHAVTAAAYAGLAWHFWRTRWRTGAVRPGAAARAWERAALAVPLVLHGGLLYADVVASGAPRFGFAHALSAMMWMAVVFYWFESLFYDLDGILPPALLLAALAAPLPAIFPGRASDTLAASLELRVHVVLAMLAYSLFTLASLHALLMALLERRLHGGAPPVEGRAVLAGPLGGLPPLLTLERLLFRMIGAAFVLLTCTLVTGIVFSESLFGQALQFDHKTLFALFSWVTFAGLLAGRYLYGWRGRLAVRWTLTGFVLLLLAYVGSRFVLEVLLGRG
jgi:ABC-type uncharacterized transport system permease subunit